MPGNTKPRMQSMVMHPVT